ncbi:MAG: hypothetical protein Q8R38_07705 [Candidatus Omnitrophota bacterium]|nr:hypothetical protein [Candidatus Omnitrophota bacterium]
MIVKKKSLIVGLVSSFVIALVLVLTLAGYFIYLEFKAKEFETSYHELLGKAKAKIYSKYIAIEKLDARIENTGPLKGKPIIEGTVTNKGAKEILDLCLIINFLDKDNAVIYQTQMYPQEPSLGGSVLPYVNIPYLSTHPKTVLKPNESYAFKKIILNCPTEIFLELREGEKPKKSFGKWSGRLTADNASLDF